MRRDAIPQKVKGYRSKSINGIIDCLHSLWPLVSASMLINMSARGTSYEVKRPGAGGGGGKSSFAYKGSSGAVISIYGGRIRWSGRSGASVPDGANVEVTGGTETAPQYLCLRISSVSGPADWSLVSLSSEPDDDGTYFFKILHEVYLVGGVARVGRDRRHDWSFGSPIQ